MGGFSGIMKKLIKMGGGFSAILGKVCKKAKKFRKGCEGVVSLTKWLHFNKHLKSTEKGSKGAPCFKHPETLQDQGCTRRVRTYDCQGLPSILSHFAKMFSCLNDPNTAQLFAQVAQRLQQYFCSAKKLRECWQRNHNDYTWCDSGMSSVLSVEYGNGYNPNGFLQKKDPFSKHPLHQAGHKDKTWKYMRWPLRPSKEVYLDWCRDLPPELSGVQDPDCCCVDGFSFTDNKKLNTDPKFPRNKCPDKCKGKTFDSNTIPPAWTTDALIGT